MGMLEVPKMRMFGGPSESSWLIPSCRGGFSDYNSLAFSGYKKGWFLFLLTVPELQTCRSLGPIWSGFSSRFAPESGQVKAGVWQRGLSLLLQHGLRRDAASYLSHRRSVRCGWLDCTHVWNALFFWNIQCSANYWHVWESWLVSSMGCFSTILGMNDWDY